MSSSSSTLTKFRRNFFSVKVDFVVAKVLRAKDLTEFKFESSERLSEKADSCKEYFFGCKVVHVARELKDRFNLIGGSNNVKTTNVGSGCGSVGRAVASDTRGLRFESSHWQKFIYKLNICLLSAVY